jgi:demethylmenaquinone methyltransferase / 2-methoxy-6-polyprenyl-1,4-benzoquinol methylase
VRRQPYLEACFLLEYVRLAGTLTASVPRMANRYFQLGEQRASRVEALFNAIARRYDLINDLQSLGLHRCWKRQLIHLADVRPEHIALDVCCGTGDIAFALNRGGAQVLAVDFSAPMLAEAARRQSGSARTRIGNPWFVRGDALRLPARNQSVDVVTIAYGLRNLADLDAAAREFHRVTRPGGRLLILDFGKPASPAWRAVYYAYLRLVVPLFGKVFCGDADSYRYILDSLEHYPAQAGINGLLRPAGWLDPETTNIFGGIMSLTIARKPCERDLAELRLKLT